MIEQAAVTVGLNLAATAIYATTELGRAKTQGFVREHSIDEELDDLNTEFGEALGEAIEASDADELDGVADDWDEITRRVHGLSTDEDAETDAPDDESATQYRLVFDDEEDAVETIAEATASVHGYTLSETGQLERELKEALAAAYSEAVGEFIGRIAGTEFGDALVIEAQLDQFDDLREIQDNLERLQERYARPQNYDLTDVSETGLDAAAEGLALTGPDLEFVDRPDLEGCYDAHRLLLVGPGGSGKSRALADLVENYEREVGHVVRPREPFKDAEDWKRLRNEGFEDDVLLVWDDIHDIAGQDNEIFRQTVTKVAAELPAEASLHVLAATRVEGLDSLPGRPRNTDIDSFWNEFDQVKLEPLPAAVLMDIFVRALDELGVTATDEVKVQFIEKAVDAEPSPLYVTSVVETAVDDGTLTTTDIETVPESALEIWENQYQDIFHRRVEWATVEQRYVLWTFKILNEFGIRAYPSLVEGVYGEVFDRETRELERHLKPLEEKQWFVEREDSDGNVVYQIHDVKAEAIEESVEEEAENVSNFIHRKLEDHLPRGVDGLERQCHGQCGLYFHSRNIQGGATLAEEHYLEIIGEKGLNPEDQVTHNNYANLLAEEGRADDAEVHYRRALALTSSTDDPLQSDYHEAHYNYANLLAEEGRADDAEVHYRRALTLTSPTDDPLQSHHQKAHHKYAILLQQEGRLDDAEAHYRRALTLTSPTDDPLQSDYHEAHYNYASGLAEEKDAVPQMYGVGTNGGTDRLEAHGIDTSPEGDLISGPAGALLAVTSPTDDPLQSDDHEAHYNYANLLKQEGRADDAEDHYRRALVVTSPTDDPLQSDYAEAHYNYATLLWPELDNPSEARDHLETSVNLWVEQGIVTNALNDLRTLVLVCRELGDTESVVEYCDLATDLLDDPDEDRPDDRRWFRSLQVLADDDAPTPEMYQMALLNVRASEPALAINLFRAAWNRRDEHDAEETTELSAARAAGVALAAHAVMFEDADLPTVEEILAELDPEDLYSPEDLVYEQLTGDDPGIDPEDLYSPEGVVYAQLAGDNPDTDPEDLLDSAREHQEEGNKFGALEAQIFAILLDQLQ